MCSTGRCNALELKLNILGKIFEICDLKYSLSRKTSKKIFDFQKNRTNKNKYCLSIYYVRIFPLDMNLIYSLVEMFVNLKFLCIGSVPEFSTFFPFLLFLSFSSPLNHFF